MELSSFSRPRRMTVYKEQSPTVSKLMTALAKAMAEFTPIARDGMGEVLRNGKRQTYRYSTLDSLHRATKPALLKQGVVPVQEYCVSDEGVTLVTSLHCGDEYITSVLPIRQYEDQQRLKAHMSYMRRTAYEGILCLSSEDDTDGQDERLPADHPAAEQPVDKVPAAKVWAMQLDLAAKAIAEAKTQAAVENVVARAKKKCDDGDFDPHMIGRVEDLADKRIAEIKRQATPAKAMQRQEVTA